MIWCLKENLLCRLRRIQRQPRRDSIPGAELLDQRAQLPAFGTSQECRPPCVRSYRSRRPGKWRSSWQKK